MWQARVSVFVVAMVVLAGVGGGGWISGYRAGVASAARLCGGFSGASAAARQSLAALGEALAEGERSRAARALVLDVGARNDSEATLCGIGRASVERLRVGD